MKNKVSVFLKHVVSVLTSIAKAKSAAIKSKTSAAKGRLVLFSLMNSRKVLFGSISDKIQSLLGHSGDDEDDGDIVAADQSGPIVLYEAKASESRPSTSSTRLYGGYDDEGDDKYLDLRHSLFDGEEDEFEDDDEANPSGSVIDLVKNAKEGGDEFCLEDEIDHAADLFIRRFHKQMRLQKLESFKRLQEMLRRSV